MSLVVNKKHGETWREAVYRYAQPWGLQDDCLAIFDNLVRNNLSHNQAAWEALYEWDCLDYRP